MQSSSNIGDRALHEIYAYPFLQSVLAGVGSVMCSYNKVWKDKKRKEKTNPLDQHYL